MLKQVLTTSLALTSVLLGAGQSMAGSFFIDNFDQPFDDISQDISIGGAPPVTTGSNPDTKTLLPNTDVIGGSRTLSLAKRPGSNNAFTRARVLPGITGDPNGSLAINNDDGVLSKTTLRWDGGNDVGLNSVGQGDLLTRLGTSNGRFGINFNSLTLGKFDATITISDGTKTKSVSINDLVGSTTYNQFLLSDFASGMDAVNLRNVRYIELVLDGDSASAADIDSFRMYEIPEPSALAGSIFALGLGVTFLRRRQENND
ncbi:MAG: hypothetical protein RLZZ148_545 [Cyanobacteriota bacterium]|jgi:hypothetical protein